MNTTRFSMGNKNLGVAYTIVNDLIHCCFYYQDKLVSSAPITSTKSKLRLSEDGILCYWHPDLESWFELDRCWRLDTIKDGGFKTWIEAVLAAKIETKYDKRQKKYQTPFISFKCEECREFFVYEDDWCLYRGQPICCPCRNEVRELKGF